jgi:hypothetical protein
MKEIMKERNFRGGTHTKKTLSKRGETLVHSEIG